MKKLLSRFPEHYERYPRTCFWAFVVFATVLVESLILLDRISFSANNWWVVAFCTVLEMLWLISVSAMLNFFETASKFKYDQRVKNKVTGHVGTVSGTITYPDGCVKYYVYPGAQADGSDWLTPVPEYELEAIN